MKEIFLPYIETVKGVQVIKLDNVRILSNKLGLSIKETELLLLHEGIVPYRYTGNVRYMGVDGQIRLLSSTVCIIGCGGLGGSIAEFCARLGIGKIILVDGDRFEESNLNRQLFSAESLIGKYKAECGKERINAINSAIEVEAYTEFADSDNIKTIIDSSSCVIDALDNIDSRFLLQDACRDLSIPLVHGAIGDTLIHVSTILPGDNSLDNLYGRDTKRGELPLPGNPMVTVALCAALEVSEAAKILLGKGEILRNKLLHFDWLYDDLNIFNV